MYSIPGVVNESGREVGNLRARMMSSWLTTMKKVNLKSQGTLCRIIGNKKGLGKVFGGGEALARIEARKWNQDGNHLWAFSPGHVSELVSSFCFYRPSILLCTN